jgi:uncharacterized membrane protein
VADNQSQWPAEVPEYGWPAADPAPPGAAADQVRPGPVPPAGYQIPPAAYQVPPPAYQVPPPGYPVPGLQHPGYQNPGYQAARMNASMRAATADRERAVDVLKAGFAEGRLSQEEYNDRMGRAYAARTYGELSALTADLPAGPLPTVWAAPQVYQPPMSTNSLARASMILGVAEFFSMGLTAIPAVICGHIAKREMRLTGQRGDGLATAGLVLGYMAIIFWAVIIVLAVLGAAISIAGQGGPAPG